MKIISRYKKRWYKPKRSMKNQARFKLDLNETEIGGKKQNTKKI